MTRVQRDTTICAGIILASLAMLIWVIPAYTPPYPGYGASPALVPNVAVGVMLAMALLGLARNVLALRFDKPLPPEESIYPEDGESAGFTQVGRARLLHLLKFILPCALLVPGLNYLGFFPTSILFLLAIQFLVGQRHIPGAVFLAVAATAVMYVVMRYGFSVPIPGS